MEKYIPGRCPKCGAHAPCIALGGTNVWGGPVYQPALKGWYGEGDVYERLEYRCTRCGYVLNVACMDAP